MVTQKPISARINYERLKDLEQESFASNMSKNEIINRAIEVYCHFTDARQRAIAYDKSNEWNKTCALLTLPRYRI